MQRIQQPNKIQQSGEYINVNLVDGNIASMTALRNVPGQQQANTDIIAGENYDLIYPAITTVMTAPTTSMTLLNLNSSTGKSDDEADEQK